MDTKIIFWGGLANTIQPFVSYNNKINNTDDC